MTRTLLTAVVLIALIECLLPSPVQAQSLRPVQGAYLNTVGIGTSIGFKEGDASFWGVAVDYSRAFKGSWVFNVSLGYDQETSPNEGGASGDKVVNSFTPALAVGYVLSPRLVVGASAGHGILSDDNDAKEMRSVEWGSDFTVGAVFGVTLWQRGPHAIDTMGSLEYAISDEKWSVSLDLGYGFSF